MVVCMIRYSNYVHIKCESKLELLLSYDGPEGRTLDPYFAIKNGVRRTEFQNIKLLTIHSIRVLIDRLKTEQFSLSVNMDVFEYETIAEGNSVEELIYSVPWLFI